MARINYPGTILEWVELFKKVKAAVLALATPNSIAAYLTQSGISLVTDDTNIDAAKAAHLLAIQKESDGEKFTEEGNKLFGACKERHRGMAQNLKSIHREDVHQVGDWGIVVNNVSKLVYKTIPVEHAEEMRTLVTKHLTYTLPPSPLQGYINAKSINIAQHGTDITDALAAYANADAAHGAAETQNELCSNLINPVIEHLRGIGQAAMSMYDDRPQKAGDLGFTIDASKRPAVLRTITLDGGQELDLKKVDVGSFIEVNGEGSVLITPKTARLLAKGSSGIANTTQKFLVLFGYGYCTVKNEDAASKVTISYYSNR